MSSSDILSSNLLPKVAIDLRNVFVYLIKNPCQLLRIEVIVIFCLFALFVLFKCYIAWCIISTKWDCELIRGRLNV
jgi:hypothetical protein